MEQTISHRLLFPATDAGSSNPPTATGGSGGEEKNTESTITKLVAENSVVVFSRKGCCMCHVIKLLLHGHGVRPTIFEVDDRNETVVARKLIKVIGASAELQFPAVFVGGELIGGLDKVMGAHISGELVPKLKEAKALWL